MDLSFILGELGEERENYFNAVSPPIMQTSNFAFRKVDDLGKALRIRDLKIETEKGEMAFFKQGNYNKTSGLAVYFVTSLPLKISNRPLPKAPPSR